MPELTWDDVQIDVVTAFVCDVLNELQDDILPSHKGHYPSRESVEEKILNDPKSLPAITARNFCRGIGIPIPDFLLLKEENKDGI